jgi:uncharacterized protein
VAFLLVHGLESSGPQHWQTWLAERLRGRGFDVAYPLLPDADRPRVDAWLAVLRAELNTLPAAETIVLCHSLGSLLWLHHAARPPVRRVARVLLVSPPQPDEDEEQSAGFRPTPLDRDGVAEASAATLLICSRDDPWCPPLTSERIAHAISAPVDWLERAGHVNTDAGYGPWPAVEEWALGARERF